MDEGARIPIDVGQEISSAAAEAGSNQRTTVREDGTIVIDILIPPRCEPAEGDEIVVCAEAERNQRLGGQGRAAVSTTLMERIGKALNIKLGPVQLGSIDRGDGTRAFGAQVKF